MEVKAGEEDATTRIAHASFPVASLVTALVIFVGNLGGVPLDRPSNCVSGPPGKHIEPPISDARQ